jgi:glucose/arabinose dehydrogenase/mono/diheme cytochrome c family protein
LSFPFLVRYILFLLTVIAFGCKQRSQTESTAISTDQASIERGKFLFTQDCSACHNFNNNGIGPHLGGLTENLEVDYIKSFIRDSKALIDAGNERAEAQFVRFNGAVMPSFSHYSDDDVSAVIAYMHTQKAPKRREEVLDGTELMDPIPEPIPMSGLVMEIVPFTTIPQSSDVGQKTRICKLEIRPDTKELFIVDLRGKLYRITKGNPELYLDMTKERPKFIDKPGLATGFGSFAFHPEFAQNGLLYTTHTEPAGTAPADFAYNDSIKVMLQWVLTEWKTSKPDGFPFEGEGREMFRANMVHSFHGVQEVTFNPLAKKGDKDYGLLYIGIGDGSSVEFGFPFLAHSLDKIWGTIIRIDPRGKNSKNGQYGIPSSNPFVDSRQPSALGEIYAYGFRNPHRISWTRDGRILSSNIGHHNIEALNLVEAGNDYGWPIREGKFLMKHTVNMHRVYALPPEDADYKVAYPVAQYDHGEGNAISGGYEYWGTTIPELKGKYIFGDIVNGRLFYVELDEVKQGSQAQMHEWQISFNGQIKTLRELCGAQKVDVRFGRDAEGELYILTKPDGMVYKLVRAVPQS